jgi:hypothetical protein
MWKFYRTQQVITTEYICLQHTPEMNGKLAITIHAIEKNWVTPAGTVNCKVSTNVLNKKLKDLQDQGEQCKLMDGYDLLRSHGMHEPERIPIRKFVPFEFQFIILLFWQLGWYLYMQIFYFLPYSIFTHWSYQRAVCYTSLFIYFSQKRKKSLAIWLVL